MPGFLSRRRGNGLLTGYPSLEVRSFDHDWPARDEWQMSGLPQSSHGADGTPQLLCHLCLGQETRQVVGFVAHLSTPQLTPHRDDV